MFCSLFSFHKLLALNVPSLPFIKTKVARMANTKHKKKLSSPWRQSWKGFLYSHLSGLVSLQITSRFRVCRSLSFDLGRADIPLQSPSSFSWFKVKFAELAADHWRQSLLSSPPAAHRLIDYSFQAPTKPLTEPNVIIRLRLHLTNKMGNKRNWNKFSNSIALLLFRFLYARSRNQLQGTINCFWVPSLFSWMGEWVGIVRDP